MRTIKGIIVISFICSFGLILELTDSIPIIAKDIGLTVTWLVIAKWILERWFPQRCMWLK